MGKFMFGTCEVCGKKHKRPAPCTVAVCEANGVHGEVVIVTLKSSHPSFRYELRKQDVRETAEKMICERHTSRDT